MISSGAYPKTVSYYSWYNVIGILGGSFDPIHFGHIHLALEMIEKRGLTKVLFCPAKQNPLKKLAPLASVEERFKMVEIALEDVPHCVLFKEEALREGPSYAYKTVELLHEKERELAYILTDETLLSFPNWKYPEKILEKAFLLVGSRISHNKIPLKDKFLEEAVQKGWTETLRLDISSSLIRERLKNHLYCTHLLPQKVIDFIFENKLYSTA
jgi:nicotinate-nucleotide adenylyltransferase